MQIEWHWNSTLYVRCVCVFFFILQSCQLPSVISVSCYRMEELGLHKWICNGLMALMTDILINFFFPACDLWTGRGYNSFFLVIDCILCLLCSFSRKWHLWICGFWCLLCAGKQHSDYSLPPSTPVLCFIGRFILEHGIQYSFIYLFWNFELQALCVFVLYVRCTAIDPADVGIVLDCDQTSKNRSKLDEELAGWNMKATGLHLYDLHTLSLLFRSDSCDSSQLLTIPGNLVYSVLAGVLSYQWNKKNCTGINYTVVTLLTRL